MRVSVVKLLSELLIVVLVSPTTLVRAAGAEHLLAPSSSRQGIQASIDRAARSAALQSNQAPVPTTPAIPRTMAPKDRTSKQGGGGSTAMVVSLVTTLAGLAGTYYVVKTMRDQAKTDQAAGLR